jgi:periplasmic divalent cation tolerance protein
MKLIYCTLNNEAEARKIGNLLLEKDLANCVNFFPITTIYKINEEVTEEPEVVLIVKTSDNNYDAVSELVKSEVDYTNFIGQLAVEKVNADFAGWLHHVVED